MGRASVAANSGIRHAGRKSVLRDCCRRFDNGDSTTYSYDDMHRLTGRSYSKASGSPTYPSSQGPDSFGYDRTGRMISADRDYGSPYSNIELALAYDKANRVTSVAENAGTSYTVGYTYVVNTSNDYRDVTYPDGRVIREANDLRGRVDTIVDRGAGGTGTPVTLADNAYDLNNRQTSRAFPNYVTAGWTYDDAGRVSGVAHTYSAPPYTSATFLVMLGYGRDDVGNPLYREDAVESSHSEKYWYDDANRLTQFKRGTLNSGKTDIASTDYTTDANLTQKNVWTLDKLGNWGAFLKRNNGTEITEPRTNNTANEYLTIDPDGSGGASPLSLAHDGNGNLTDDGTYTYEYDIENRMTRVKAKSGGATLADYHYDALGRRIRKIIPSGTDAGTWTYVVNELWQVVSEYKTVSSTTTHQKRFVHAGRNAYVDDHVAMWDITAGPKIFYYHADAQVCTVAMTSDTGSVAERYVTDPYGKAVTYTSAWGSPQATSRIGNPFMHQGLWLDCECGKYQNRNREYLAILGRFAQRDPLQYVDGQHLSCYLQSMPTGNRDPEGQAINWWMCSAFYGNLTTQCAQGQTDCERAAFKKYGAPNPVTHVWEITDAVGYIQAIQKCEQDYNNCMAGASGAYWGCVAGHGLRDFFFP